MALGDRLVPPGQSWEFNQAMFDLGATVCTAARPACARARCAASAPGGASGMPRRARRRPMAAQPDGATAEHLRRLRPPGPRPPARRAPPWRRAAQRPGGGLRVARRPGAGGAGHRRCGRGGLRPVVRREGSRPPAAAERRLSRRREELHDVTVDDVGPFDVEEVAGVVDDFEGGSLRHEVQRGADGGQQHAAVVAAVEVQRRLGRRQQRGRLLVRQLGHLQRGVPHGAVVADRRQHVLGVADGLLHPGHVPRAVVAR